MMKHIFVKECLLEFSGEKKRRPRVKTQPELRWEVKPIGVVVSPYETKYGVPKQATISARNDTLFSDGRIVLFPGYENCICNLEGFDYIWVISLMHLNNGRWHGYITYPTCTYTRKEMEETLFSPNITYLQ